MFLNQEAAARASSKVCLEAVGDLRKALNNHIASCLDKDSMEKLLGKLTMHADKVTNVVTAVASTVEPIPVAASLKNKKALPDKKPVVESKIHGSKPINMLNVGCLLIQDNTFNGYFVSGGDGLRFRTHFHNNDGGVKLFTLIKDTEQTLITISGKHKMVLDRAYVYYVNGKMLDVVEFVIGLSSSVVIGESATVGRNCNGSGILIAYDGSKFVCVNGELSTDDNLPDHGNFEGTTYPGYCRAPVFNSEGKVVGGHKYGRSGMKPNCFELDMGLNSIPCKKWDWKYVELVGNLFSNTHARGDAREVILKNCFRCRCPEAFEDEGDCYAEGKCGFHFANGQPRHDEEDEYTTLTQILAVQGVNYLKGDKFLRMPHVSEGKVYKWIEDDSMVPLHVPLKPSPELVVRELERFREALPNNKPPRHFLDLAERYILSLDERSFSFWLPPEFSLHSDSFKRMLNCVLSLDSSAQAGFVVNGTCNTQKELLQLLGEGNEEVGAYSLASLTLQVIDYICQGYYFPELWYTFGKDDFYKLSKLAKDKTRSIQSCSVIFKLIWMYCFGVSDKRWSDDAFNNHCIITVKRNEPIPSNICEIYRKAKYCESTDVDQFDRSAPAYLLQSFVYSYLRHQIYGIPLEVLHYVFLNLAGSIMIRPDNSIQVKERGNPSGFPNTIRLNCYLLRMAVYTTLFELYNVDSLDDLRNMDKEVWPEFCGDDLRIWVGDKALYNYSKFEEIFYKNLPWTLTYNGKGDFNNAVEFIGCTIGEMNGHFYHMLVHSYKIVSKLTWQMHTDVDKQIQQFQGIVVSLLPNIIMHKTGKRIDPSIEWLMKQEGFEELFPIAINAFSKHLMVECSNKEED